MKNVRGTLGRTVYCKQMYGKTVMCNMPRKPDRSKETEAQRATRYAFKEAVHYAKTATKDPGLKAYYQRKAKELKLPNAYTAALTDYMRKGKNGSTSHKQYTGKAAGQLTTVAREKDFARPDTFEGRIRKPVDSTSKLKISKTSYHFVRRKSELQKGRTILYEQNKNPEKVVQFTLLV